MNVTVYCSSRNVAEYYDLAARVGREIAQAGDTLVFGGIRRGLMEVVATAAQEAGGEVVGVIPESKRHMADATRAERNDRNIFTDGLAMRKAVMIEMADRFVALPGGYGTLDEIFSTLASLSFEGGDKMIDIYNPGGLYDDTRRQLQLMAERGLIGKGILNRLNFIDL